MTLVGLVSDTHDNLALARRAAAFLRERSPDLVLHLGDITTGAAVGCFSGLPVRFLRGNNDTHPGLARALAHHGFPPLDDSWSATVAGVRVGATHGHRRAALRDLVARHQLVLHGHTHRMRADLVGPTLVVNPGALYRVHRKTLALVRLPDRAVEFFEVTRENVTPLAPPRPR